MPQTVLVIGGGIAGLTAAHELSARGFAVRIIDPRDIPGGKSRTIPVPHSGTDGRPDLPGEHGFRFFPGFYRHLPETMRGIPLPDGQGTVFENLVPTQRVDLVRFGIAGMQGPTGFPHSLEDFKLILHDLFDPSVHFEPGEMDFFGDRLWQVATSCTERRLAELEQITWWEFIGAESRSENYRLFLAEGLSRSLVAARAQEASARTVGQVQVHLIAGLFDPLGCTDRVLNGPTTEAFLGPWLRLLEGRGVTYETATKADWLAFADGRITGVTVRAMRTPIPLQTYTADWYVLATPVEAANQLVNEAIIQADPALKGLAAIAPNVRWMNGIQFFLNQDVQVVRGHVLYVDSPWSITSISQQQFWPDHPLCSYGDGGARGVISVDISDWDDPGHFYPQPAKALPYDQIADEVWQELKLSLNVGGQVVLTDEMKRSWFMDSDVEIRDPGRPRDDINLEQLFINKPNTWPLRPQANTTIPNLVLCADYVQTNSDLACMEAACEAGRRAVNALLDKAGSPASRCTIYEMDMPEILEAWRHHDLTRFRKGEAWDGKLFT